MSAPLRAVAAMLVIAVLAEAGALYRAPELAILLSSAFCG